MYNVFQKISLIAICLLLLSAGCNKQSPAPHTATDDSGTQYNRQLKIGDKILDVQVVTTPVDMEQGLSGRPSMADNQGMLFGFGVATGQDFWMKDMDFDLDFIWIKNNSVIFITKDVAKPNPGTPDEQLPTYSPPSPVDMVLEVNAGWAERNKIKTGDEARLIN